MDTLRRAKELAGARGMSLSQLAKLSGISYSTLKSAEARNYQLSVDTIEHICKGLDMPLRDFFPAPERSDNL